MIIYFSPGSGISSLHMNENKIDLLSPGGIFPFKGWICR